METGECKNSREKKKEGGISGSRKYKKNSFRGGKAFTTNKSSGKIRDESQPQVGKNNWKQKMPQRAERPKKYTQEKHHAGNVFPSLHL